MTVKRRRKPFEKSARLKRDLVESVVGVDVGNVKGLSGLGYVTSYPDTHREPRQAVKRLELLFFGPYPIILWNQNVVST